MEIKAKLLEKYETASFGASGFQKREFVVEFAENPEYPEFVKFELIQDKCELLDGFNIGQELNVSFNLKGRKWTNPKGEVVYFNSLQAWKVTAATGAGDMTPQRDQNEAAIKEPEWLEKNSQGNEPDDLPF